MIRAVMHWSTDELPVCGQSGFALNVSLDPSRVTCRRCLRWLWIEVP